MENWLQMQLLLLVFPVILGSAVYAVAVATTAWFMRTNTAYLIQKAALCWFFGLSAALWIGFEVVDARAAATHSRNIGIPIVFAWAWFTMVLPAPDVGRLILSLVDRWRSSVGNSEEN